MAEKNNIKTIELYTEFVEINMCVCSFRWQLPNKPKFCSFACNGIHLGTQLISARYTESPTNWWNEKKYLLIFWRKKKRMKWDRQREREWNIEANKHQFSPKNRVGWCTRNTMSIYIHQNLVLVKPRQTIQTKRNHMLWNKETR